MVNEDTRVDLLLCFASFAPKPPAALCWVANTPITLYVVVAAKSASPETHVNYFDRADSSPCVIWRRKSIAD